MRRRTKSDWEAVFQAQAKSGMTAATFCREQGINAKYFSLRRRQLSAAPGEAGVAFRAGIGRTKRSRRDDNRALRRQRDARAASGCRAALVGAVAASAARLSDGDVSRGLGGVPAS